MTRRPILFAILALVVVVGGAAMVIPGVALVMDDGTDLTHAGQSGSSIQATNARLVLPPVAGGEASIYMDLTNRGEALAYVTAISVTNASLAEFRADGGAAARPVENIDLAPGQTVNLTADSQYVAVQGYNSNVVPGTEVTVRMRTANSEVIETQATVQAFPQP